ncbi:sulfate permease [Maribacter sp. MMG018]|uniref:SulP family inorganic anion transporter n=1 Tax=Maribacter sp. MMG018 TaxID=2822688 RepID=UPI001B38078D|nr:sulfate permease [Maribacter sp. MMG018]MBQ4913269.1 sulfate permease [Maribacter sp. MMG018]
MISIPIINRVKHYNFKLFQSDLISGLTVGVMIVPQGMAYAMLAGVPPIYGLYGAIVPLFLYAIFGTSHAMAIGPVAISSLLIFAGISEIAVPGSPEFISFVILSGFFIGLLKLLTSIMRLGFLVNFLSKPVIIGFTSAAAIIIAISQVKYVLGVHIPTSSSLLSTIQGLSSEIDNTNVATALVCISGITLMLLLKKLNKKIPGALLVVILSVAVVSLFHLEDYGITIVKEVPKGFPSFLVPNFTIENIRLVMPTVLTVTVISIVESISIAKVWESKYNATQDPKNRYKIDANQELFALGIAKIGGSFFQALPSSGSFTRSAINHESGAKTQISSIITALFVTLVLLFFTPLFYYLPQAILAAIILVSVVGLFEYKEAFSLWKTHRSDFYMLLTSFILTLVVGIKEGVFAGIFLSIIVVVYRLAKPDILVLGKLPNTSHFRCIHRYPEAEQVKNCKIIRFNGQLFFANSDYLKDFIVSVITENSNIKVLIIDASNIHDVDSTGIKMLKEVKELLEAKDIHFYFANTIGSFRDRLHRAGLTQKIVGKNHFMSILEAVEYSQEQIPEQEKTMNNNVVYAISSVTTKF